MLTMILISIQDKLPKDLKMYLETQRIALQTNNAAIGHIADVQLLEGLHEALGDLSNRIRTVQEKNKEAQYRYLEEAYFTPPPY